MPLSALIGSGKKSGVVVDVKVTTTRVYNLVLTEEEMHLLARLSDAVTDNPAAFSELVSKMPETGRGFLQGIGVVNEITRMAGRNVPQATMQIGPDGVAAAMSQADTALGNAIGAATRTRVQGDPTGVVGDWIERE